MQRKQGVVAGEREETKEVFPSFFFFSFFLDGRNYRGLYTDGKNPLERDKPAMQES